MSYFKKVPSLEERASLEVALNLCQEDNFKAAALRLERPTYGFFYLEREFPLFVNNPKKLLKLNERKLNASNDSSKFFRLKKDTDILEYHQKPPFVNDPRISSLWEKSGIGVTINNCLNDDNGVGRWYFAIEQQCQKLTKSLPHSLKLKVCVWLHRIALEYVSYCRRQEVLFGVSRYFLMNFLTREDWTEACRLDEKKLAERMLKDEQLTVSQRYRIACVYCMVDDIPQLWKRLTTNEKNNMSKNTELTMSEETTRLIQIWSLHMNKNKDKVTAGENKLLSDVVRQLVVYGNAALLMPFWKKLEEQVRQNIITDLALLSVKHWQMVEPELNLNSKGFFTWRKKLFSNEVFSMRNCYVSCFNLQSYYSELILFFLLEMNEDQKVLFFQKSFEIEQFNILECFLDWPIRDYFLKTINQLWGIMPMDKYSHCLVALASLCSASYHTTLQFEYSENYRMYYCLLTLDYKFPEGFFWYNYYNHYCNSLYKKGNQYYDYQNLLWKLWEETPEIYKQGLFYDQSMNPFFVVRDTIKSSFFTQLLKRSPFQVKDEALFKLIFSNLPQTDRAPMIRSEIGQEICCTLLEKEKYSLVTWLLHQCLEEGEIPYYKKQLIHSDDGRKLCFYKLQENHESSLSDLLDWSFNLDSEKTQFKCKLFNEKSCSFECQLLLRRGEFAEVERIMNFCLLSNDCKREFKARCAELTCDTLLADNKFEQLDKVLTWCLDTEDNIKNFKKDFFTRVGLRTHYRLVFLKKWKEVQLFYEWFDLSPAEIRRLKNKTVVRNFRSIERGLFHRNNVMDFFVAPLRWCLMSEKAVFRFEHQVRRKCFGTFNAIFSFFTDDNTLEIAEDRLLYLVEKLLFRPRKLFQNEAIGDRSVLGNKGKKRPLEEKDVLPRKCK